MKSVVLCFYQPSDASKADLRSQARDAQAGQALGWHLRQRSDIEDALIELARKLSNKRHVFVSSISTSDVETLLLKRYADYTQEYTEYQQKTSDEIIETIKQHKRDKAVNSSDKSSDVLLDEIRTKIESMEGQRVEIMAPMDTVRLTVERLIRHTGISIGPRLSFGDAAGAITSDLLSAGEKQMLSFICYNAFNDNAVIFNETIKSPSPLSGSTRISLSGYLLYINGECVAIIN